MDKRDFSFDALRGIAIFFVVFIHVNSLGYLDGSSSFNEILSVILRQLSNFAVPLFLFISGYFMGNKKFGEISEYLLFLRKQLPRVLVPFVIWSVFYSMISHIQGVSFDKILYKFFTFQAASPLYYILLICQYYILHPLIEFLARTKTGLAASFAISAISCVAIEYFRYELYISLPLYIYAGLFTTWIIFPVLGMFVRKRILSYNQKVFFLILALTFIGSVTTSFALIEFYHDVEGSVSAIKVTSFAFSIAMIVTMYRYRDLFKESKVFITLGRMSFGIYFSHWFFLTVSKIILNRILTPEIMTNVLTQLVLTIIIVGASVCTGIVLKTLNVNLSSKLFGY